jgi:hypothetical protein
MMETTIAPYVWPKDGHDICHSCDYLTVVHTTMLIAFEDIMVPLCFECAMKIGE